MLCDFNVKVFLKIFSTTWNPFAEIPLAEYIHHCLFPSLKDEIYIWWGKGSLERIPGMCIWVITPLLIQVMSALHQLWMPSPSWVSGMLLTEVVTGNWTDAHLCIIEQFIWPWHDKLHELLVWASHINWGFSQSFYDKLFLLLVSLGY